PAHHVLVLSDYGKGVLSRGRAQRLISAARTAGIPVIVDPKGADYGIYAGADVITPNRKEIREASGMPAVSIDDAADAAKAIADRHDLTAVLVTLSQDGMLLAEAGDVHHLPAETREVFDVSGAGDTVVATIAGALGAGASLTDAARLANVCAGIVVAKAGTAAADLAEVVATLHHQDISRAEAKLLNHDQTRDRVAIWRRQGFKVGFTNGCFDLLHPGHVSLLRQASNACDRLVVALNSDASVKRLKGEARPIQNEAARATVLASLAHVDQCVLFDADTPIDLITLLKPDVLIKGADYTVEQVVGAPEVQSWGGRIVIVELEDGFSTTATIARMTENSNGDTS
ncbi:MAG: D-glycero-beta-D-manno-heptose 1-phosphate adenylyltransferase, partial [Rhodospirillales bacterium]|nr:D-glycero-beta-D-manno-heptose 1-phosphate adenylyltransferase [Rhodospirillales bacterium]